MLLLGSLLKILIQVDEAEIPPSESDDMKILEKVNELFSFRR